MRKITIRYEFGKGYEYKITPTKEDLCEFLEYYSEYTIKKVGFEFLSAVLGIDLEKAVFDYDNAVYSDFEWWLKDKYIEKAYEEYKDGGKH